MGTRIIQTITNRNGKLPFQALRMALLSGVLGVSVIMPAVSSAQADTTSAPATNTPQQSMPFGVAPELVMNAGDLLDVQVFGTPELSGRFRVNQNGDLQIPLAGVVHLAGLTSDQAAAAIENMLRTQQIMLSPHVHVSVSEYLSQGLTIMGEVKKPGVYPLYGSVTLYDLLSAAGGFTTQTGSSLTIVHRGSSETKVIEIHSPNYSDIQHTTTLLPGDTVVVAQGELIYVLGDVGAPGQYSMVYGQPMTLLKLMSLAHGLNETAKSSKAAIIRQTPTGVKTINVDLHHIIKQQDKDMVLQRDDVLVVPRSGFKTILQTALPAFTNTLTTTAVTTVLLR